MELANKSGDRSFAIPVRLRFGVDASFEFAWGRV
jgi:hypothetical protein